MDLGLKDKRALVLASSRGIGYGIAEALAAEGARLVMCSRDAGSIAEAAARLEAAHGVTAKGVACDISDAAQINTLADTALAEMGGVDILVGNYGGPPPGPISQVKLEDWQGHFQTMVLSIIGLTQRVLPPMRTRGWGRILIVGSSGVKQPIPHLGISNTLRSALLAWAKTLSMEVDADGVPVNAILPGRNRTERTLSLDKAAAERTGRTYDEVLAEGMKSIPAGRQGEASVFGSMAAFLASDQASYITCSAIAVDGGAIKQM